MQMRASPCGVVRFFANPPFLGGCVAAMPCENLRAPVSVAKGPAGTICSCSGAAGHTHPGEESGASSLEMTDVVMPQACRRPASPHQFDTRAARRRKDAAALAQSDAALSKNERCYDVHANSLAQLGTSLAQAYRFRFEAGLRRSREYFLTLEPVSCSDEQWKKLSTHLRTAAHEYCPVSNIFFDAFSQELNSDVYAGLLDFEVYTLELQRQARQRRLKRLKRDSQCAKARQALDSAQSCGDMQGILAAEQSLKIAANSISSSSESSDDSTCTLDPIRTERHDTESSCSEGDHVTRISSSTTNTTSSDGTSDSSVGPKPVETAGPIELHGRCTGFALAVGGTADSVLAQSVDLPAVVYGFGDFDCILRLSTPAGNILAYDVDGRLCPIGLNSAGLGVTVFNLFQPHTAGFECPALSIQMVAWELLLGQHTLTSALTWLRSLPTPGVMCGGGLLLADGASAVMVELSAGHAPAISDLTIGAPLVRANHTVLLPEASECGESRKSVKESKRRQDRLTRTLSAVGDPCLHGANVAQDDAQPSPDHKLASDSCRDQQFASGMTAQTALRILAASKGIRNVSTLACIACDLKRRLLRVEFRERQAVGDAETKGFAKSQSIPVDRASRLLLAGAVRRQAKTGPRMETGEPARHFTRWEAYEYTLDGSTAGLISH